MNRKSVLGDHKRLRRKLVPPLLSAFGDKSSPYSWARELAPELLWISLLLETHGHERGVELANAVAGGAADVCSREPKPMFAKITSFLEITAEENARMRSALSTLVIDDVLEALMPLHLLCPE